MDSFSLVVCSKFVLAKLSLVESSGLLVGNFLRVRYSIVGREVIQCFAKLDLSFFFQTLHGIDQSL